MNQNDKIILQHFMMEGGAFERFTPTMTYRNGKLEQCGEGGNRLIVAYSNTGKELGTMVADFHGGAWCRSATGIFRDILPKHFIMSGSLFLFTWEGMYTCLKEVIEKIR